MPTQVMNDSNSANTEIKVKTAYNGEIMITYIDENISFDELCNEIRGICRFSPDQVNWLLKVYFCYFFWSDYTHTYYSYAWSMIMCCERMPIFESSTMLIFCVKTDWF